MSKHNYNSNYKQVETMDFLEFQQNVGKYDLTAHKLDIVYKHTDPRAWTAIINQDKEAVIVTYFINRNDLGERNFDIISSERNMFKLEQDDICQTLDMIINKHQTSAIISPFEQLL